MNARSVQLPAGLSKALIEERDYAEDLLARLIAKPSEYGQPTDISGVVQRELEEAELLTHTFRADLGQLSRHPDFCLPDDAPTETPFNVIGTLPGQQGDLVLFAHIDTERAGDVSTWPFLPFRATFHAGRIYGLGAADDKAGLVSIVAAVRAVIKSAVPLQCGLTVLAIHGKQGGAFGTLPAMNQLGRVNAAIYCHPPENGKGLSQIKTASRGIFSFRIEVVGHSPAPQEIGTPASADPRQGHNAIVLARSVMDTIEAWEREDRDLMCSINIISGGSHPQRMPDHCALIGTVWFETGSVAVRWNGLAEAIARAASCHPWLRHHPPACRLVGLWANPATQPDSAFIHTVQDAICAEQGQRPEPYQWHVASDIRFPMRCLGVPAVGFGATGGGFYSPDEWVDRESMHLTTSALARIIMGWCCTPAWESIP